jgi:ribosome-binding protein aMBF1 (putative translation factor)
VAECKSCGDEADELVTVKVNGKNKRICESCAEQVNEQEAIKEASEAVVQNMMGFKGRR